MLAPEVWNFEPPPSFTFYESMEHECIVEDSVSEQPFNHFVSLTIPDAIQIPPSIKDALLHDSDFYHVERLYPFELMKYEFMCHFVYRGDLTLLSVGTTLDEDDCLAVTPKGKLYFSLCRKTFQELGIEGKPSQFSNKVADKYVVTIDMKEESFRIFNRNYERVMERLKCKKDFCFDVILAWEPHKAEICPSSIAAYISNLGYKVSLCHVQSKQRLQYNVDLPLFEDCSDGEVLTEWLGAFNLECNIPENPNGYVTTYGKPEKNVRFGQVAHLQAAGLFTITRITKLVKEINKYTANMAESAWIGLTVNGFEDSVVNRCGQEHFYYSSGDYHYTVLFRNKASSLLYFYISSSRRPKTSTKKKRKPSKAEWLLG